LAGFKQQFSRGVKVLDRTANSSKDRVLEIVRQILSKRSIAPQVLDDDDLSEIGMSSLDMVNLMLAVEEEFDIKIPDRDMTPANFRCVARIDTLVTSLLANAKRTLVTPI
jgi:acyl carrier protein